MPRQKATENKHKLHAKDLQGLFWVAEEELRRCDMKRLMALLLPGIAMLADVSIYLRGLSLFCLVGSLLLKEGVCAALSLPAIANLANCICFDDQKRALFCTPPLCMSYLRCVSFCPGLNRHATPRLLFFALSFFLCGVRTLWPSCTACALSLSRTVPMLIACSILCL